MRRPPPANSPILQQPIVATVLPFPQHHINNNNNNNNNNNAVARHRRVLRGRIYLAIVIALIVYAVVLPWFLMTTTASSSPSGNNNIITPNAPYNNIPGWNQKQQQQPPDGTFNNYPVYLRSNVHYDLRSDLHCVGETHNDDTAWMYRSCHFSNLCIDTTTKEFVVFSNSKILDKLQQKRVPHIYMSTDLSNSTASMMALGGINPRWQGNDFNQGIEKVKWFPKIIKNGLNDPAAATKYSSYYELDPSVTLVPFHSFAAHNVGHMLWDDFLPIYTLLSLFFDDDDQILGGGSDASRNLLLLRDDTLPLLYGTCEMRRNKREKCAKNFEKFLPLLGVDPKTFSTVKNMKLEVINNNNNNNNNNPDTQQPTLVCAKHAVAGLGMLTDHGMKDHGWQPESETRVHNTAKGALLYRFRNFMLHNLNIPTARLPVVGVDSNDNNNGQGQQPFRILLSAHSSGDGPRDVSFENQHNVLTSAFPTSVVTTTELATVEMRQQIELVSKTNVFVSTCGGGSMTATFLPKGATLILYYQQKGGFDFAAFNGTEGPAYLDWDLFNNAAYLRVHWLPIETMDTKEGLESLMYLVRHEMEVASTGL